MQISKTPYKSWAIGKLSKGCQRCVKGEKLVLFITGICSNDCFFCPISDQKKGKDVIYANEWPLKDENDKETLLKEAKLTQATGAGITGGDPLARLERTIDFIKFLKSKFKKNFHIHIYLPLTLVDEEKLKKLHEAGLDEIRFHPNLDKKEEWKKISLAKKFSWDISVEIPCIPNKEPEILDLVKFISDKVNFLNLNELEIADTNANSLLDKGYKAKDEISYGVKGSEELAKKIMSFIIKSKFNLNVHYCTTTLKDSVQMANRIKKRAKNVKKPYDLINDEGMLIRGAIYLEDLSCDFGYRKNLQKIKESKDEEHYLKNLENIKKELQSKYKIKNELIEIDKNKLRILTSIEKAQEIAKKEKYKVAIVTEYPTYDEFEIEVEFLN